MDNPTGRVVSLIDSDDDRHAVVAVELATACPRCASGKGCGAGLFASGGGTRRVEASIRSGLDIAPDDKVEISLAPDNLLRAALIVYGLPMAGAVLAAALSYAWSFGDAVAALAALAGLAAGLLIGRWRLRQENCLRRFVPRIERQLEAGSAHSP